MTDPVEGVAELRAGPDHLLGAGRRGELAATRDVVVVEVGLEDVADPDVELGGGGEVAVDVAAGVDDDRQPGFLVHHQCREMAEAVKDEPTDQHGRSLAPGGCPVAVTSAADARRGLRQPDRDDPGHELERDGTADREADRPLPRQPGREFLAERGDDRPAGREQADVAPERAEGDEEPAAGAAVAGIS